MWKINSFIWIYFLVKNYIFPFLKTISEELKVQISESLAGIWITPPSLILPSDYDEDSELSKFFESLLTIFFCYVVIYMDVDWVLYTPLQLLLVFVFLESRT